MLRIQETMCLVSKVASIDVRRLIQADYSEDLPRVVTQATKALLQYATTLENILTGNTLHNVELIPS
jgi:hypothetical protein